MSTGVSLLFWLSAELTLMVSDSVGSKTGIARVSLGFKASSLPSACTFEPMRPVDTSTAPFTAPPPEKGGIELLKTASSDFADHGGVADTPPAFFAGTVTVPSLGRPSIGVDGSDGRETGVSNNSLVISPTAFGEDETGAMGGLTFGSEGGLTLAEGGRSANRTVQRLVDRAARAQRPWP